MGPRPDPQARQLLRAVLEGARALPGVESATLTTSVPLTLIMSNSNFVLEEREADPNRQRIRTDIYGVGPQFVDTMGMARLAGEDFGFDQAGSGRPVIVNDAFARAAFSNQSPLGRRIVGDGKRLQIVGVVATASSRTVGEAPRPSIYLPLLNEYAAREAPAGVTLVVKTRGDAASYSASVREMIRRAEPRLAVFNVRTMDSHLSDALIVPRLAGMLSTVAGGIGLVMATIGVYGVVSFAAARRRREIGIRMAIGARPHEILMLLMKQGLAPAAAGTALGFLAGVSVTRLVASLLYGVTPTDTITFVAVPSFLMVIALLACLLPARSAARLDPVDVLRSE